MCIPNEGFGIARVAREQAVQPGCARAHRPDDDHRVRQRAGEDFRVTFEPLLRPQAVVQHFLELLLRGPLSGRVKPGLAVKGFEQFSPIFFAVLLAALGILVGAVLIVPGVYLFVRWYFVPQTVVLEGAHRGAALRGSSRVVEGFWWRTFGLIVLVNVVALVFAVILGAPFTAAADRADRAVWALVGEIVASSVVQPFGALYSTLLYFDLRQRGRESVR